MAVDEQNAGATDLEALLQRYELEHGAKVVRTPDDLDYLTLDQPGPEVIGSGTVGQTGLARWQPPQHDSNFLVFYANQPREDKTADKSAHASANWLPRLLQARRRGEASHRGQDTSRT